MGAKWLDIPIEAKLFTNVQETVLTRAQAAIENAFINEAGGHSRFPGLEEVADLDDNGRVILNEWRGDLMAATSMGKLYRIDKSHNATDVTGVPISGAGRATFARSTDELVIAAGGPIIRFAGKQTEILSEDAPHADFVGFVDNYLIANEAGSGRFNHSEAGVGRTWDPLDVFSADGKPDNINSLIVTPYRELLLCGPESIEQYERLSSGDTPFFRRWAVGEGISVPHSIVAADNGVFGVNSQKEFIRFSGQTSQPSGEDIGQTLESIDDWTDAWVGGYPDKALNILGQKFIILQCPHATNTYGTKGITLLYDYRQKMWSSLFGWDDAAGVPARWPGWSHWPMWGNTYVGGEGKIYKLTTDSYANDNGVQRMLGRTAHMSSLGNVRIDNLRARVKRGVGGTESPVFSIRANRNNKGFGKWVRRGLGKDGDRELYIEFGGFGCGDTWQFEWFVTDDCPVEFTKLQVQVTKLG
jgi:hypothetical protein